MRHSGFTLVELSIVLVIIGLIVSGVVGGQSLIQSAELNKMGSQVEQYKTAIRTFESQFDALPGDMTDAYDYFDGSGGSSVCGTDSAGAGGCNGDGNRRVEVFENVRSWQHLSLANIIPGIYSGVHTGLGNLPDSKEEIYAANPASERGSFFSFFYYGIGNNNYLSLAKPFDDFGPWPLVGAILTPTDTKKFDKKFDDGLADKGKVRGRPAFGEMNCSSGGDYILSETNLGCYVLIEY